MVFLYVDEDKNRSIEASMICQTLNFLYARINNIQIIKGTRMKKVIQSQNPAFRYRLLQRLRRFFAFKI